MFLLSDRVELSSAEARVEKTKGGYVGVFEATKVRAHTPNPSQSL